MDFTSHTENDIREMLEKIGVKSLEELISSAVPEKARFKGNLNLKPPLSEAEASEELKILSSLNYPDKGFVSFLGAGAYRHFIPSVVDAVVSRPEFFTAYTPYQPEVSQGTLAAIFEFQTIIAELTGMDVANSSMYDGATALAEAVLMARRISKKPFPGKVIVLEPFHPTYLRVLEAYLKPHSIEIAVSNHQFGIPVFNIEENDLKDAFCLVLQQPTFLGTVYDYSSIIDTAKKEGLISVVVHEPHLLSLIEPPGKLGADICVGEAQPLGNQLNTGGPLLGYLATKSEHLRQMPGRIVGETVDANGNRAFVMTLQTREQHIRRERATSNICTNETLCALAATVYVSWFGPQGLKELSKQILLKTEYTREKLSAVREIPAKGPFFKDIPLRLKTNAQTFVEKALSYGIIAGVPLSKLSNNYSEDLLLISVTELTKKEEIDQLVSIVSEVDK